MFEYPSIAEMTWGGGPRSPAFAIRTSLRSSWSILQQGRRKTATTEGQEGIAAAKRNGAKARSRTLTPDERSEIALPQRLVGGKRD